LYVCEAKVTLALSRTQGTNGGLAVHAVTMGAFSSSTSNDTLEVTPQALPCSFAQRLPELMLKAPH
jgi:hypothetical protein